MKLFRIVDEKFSAFYDAYSGKGASLSGGRWNPVNVNTIYLSKSIEIAVCEKGYYSIINNAFILRNKANLTAYDKSLLLNRKYFLASAEFSLKGETKNDLTDKGILSSIVSSSSLKQSYLPVDSTLSPWSFLPEKWTVKIGSHIYSKADDSLKCLSARKNKGNNIVIYNDNFDLRRISNYKRNEVFLSICSLNNKDKWNGKSKFSLSHVFYTIPSLSKSGVVKIMDKQI